MIYYRVKQTADQTRLYNRRGKYIDFLIANELYTPAEYNGLIAISKFNIENKFEKLKFQRIKHISFSAQGLVIELNYI